MNRKKIEKEAGEYSGSILGFKNNPVVMRINKAFADGAQWAINSVWHTPNELPNGVSVIIMQLDSAIEEYSFGVKELYEGTVRWAYVSDLLPDRKEERI